MISVTVTAQEGVYGIRMTAHVYNTDSLGRRTLVMTQNYYPDLPTELDREDGLYLACVALRQWAVRTLRSSTSGQSPDKIN